VSAEVKEEEIVQLLHQRRYSEAFDLVLQSFGDKVFRLAYSVTGTRESAQDAAQDSFVRIWRALAGFRGDASLSTWVYTITRNASLSMLKKQRSQAALPLEEPSTRAAAELRHAGSHGPERGPDIVCLIQQLPDSYQQVLRLFYMEERSYGEIARMLGWPEGTVKTRLHRARKLLADMMRRRQRDLPVG
jgi:RNA polymerase sigma-70 factor (ECF subfamily)